MYEYECVSDWVSEYIHTTVLPSDERSNQERKRLEASPDELISVLESRRRALVRERDKLQAKLDAFAHGKRAERQDAERQDMEKRQ